MNSKLRNTLVVLGLATASAASANVTFYTGENFSGRQVVIDHTVDDFGNTPFNDRARSAVVDRGEWEVCVDSGFRGACQILSPGRYPNLGGLAQKISSVRPVSHRPDRRPSMGGGRGASAVLYEGANFSGRAFPMGGGADNLGGTGFNDRASSLRIEAGYWVFCSDANFNGECRTFGPGDYASLPPGFNDRISSGRRISNEYPYSQSPSWQR